MNASGAGQGVPVLRTYLEFDPEHPVTHALLTDAHKGHRITMAPFAYAMQSRDFFTGATGHADHRSAHNILWAVNTQGIAGVGSGIRTHRGEFAPAPRVRMMMQSDIEPRFDHHLCADLNDALLTDPVSRRYVPRTDAGTVIEYQVVVNPRQNTRIRVPGRDKPINRTTTPRGESQIQGWWVRKAIAAGLSPVEDPILDEPGERTLRKHGDDPGKARITHVRLTGKAMITDPSAYAEAAHVGIGSGRSYGCGLLLTR
ncbi:type I-E CRISPR-associated protein Cas6/Cse3/CasE [Mycolicibacterium austroafricanum]|uniref:type I-E CRISPR-associated protein Cas6/Cse3/CasE n=1 Tax=Mycolicibacterium austroafricanum TaxID=39687 RepID=UPI000685B308|nr:type I-E CRISPR-associated protein Cas6/Cse3/CasE [Mycolicibacterium austroafricanum]